MGINKVQYGNTTLIDLTADTVTADKLMQGYTAHDRSGALITGTATGGSGDGYVWQDAQGYVHLSDEQGTQIVVDSLTVNAGGTYTAPTGHAYSPVTVASGTAGTPTATKGTVSNHSISVTPSVTNTSGYITGSTKTGTAVSVSASELVSGTKSITQNGTGIDVTDYASVDVSVSGSATLTTKTITQNGTYNASSDNADGYSSVTVNVSGGGGASDADYKAFVERSTTTPNLPAGLTTIGAYAFYSYDDLALEYLPSTVTSIGNFAFAGIVNLPLLELPSGLISIGDYAFNNNSGTSQLTSLPSTVTTIGNFAFNNSRVKFSSLPAGVTSIGNSAFKGATLVTFSSIPSGVTSIGTSAFRECKGITISSFPSGINVPSECFYSCTGITSMTIPTGVTVIGSYAFYNCNNLGSISLPNTITSIQAYSFQYCEKLLSITCNGVITALGSSAFMGSSSHLMKLKSASFPYMALTSNLSTVFGSSTAASACQQLEFCDIGSTTGIAANAFANCYKLQTLVLRKTSAVCTLANVSAFTNTPMRGYNSLTGTVYVPSDLISSYQTATNWKTLYDGGTVTFEAIEGSDYEL